MMKKVIGYVAKFSQPEWPGIRFAPGCFDNCNGATIPAVSSDPYNQTVVGQGVLKVVDDGLMFEGEVDDSELDKLKQASKGFGFSANNVKKDKENVTNAEIRYCWLTDAPVRALTSTIESVEDI